MNSLGSCISTFGRYKKVRPENELGNYYIFSFYVPEMVLYLFTLPNAILVHNLT